MEEEILLVRVEIASHQELLPSNEKFWEKALIRSKARPGKPLVANNSKLIRGLLPSSGICWFEIQQ